MNIKEAVRQGNLKLIQSYPDSELDVYVLQLAVLEGHYEVVKYMCTCRGIVADDASVQVAAEKGFYKIVKVLHEHGANLHADRGNALFWARKNGHSKVVRYILRFQNCFNSKSF
jgi:hypothetical protein